MFYISEENLGSEATQEQAEQVVSILQAEGWAVEYGNSLNNDPATDTEQANFDAAFYAALNQVS
jgi:hypothetical protein